MLSASYYRLLPASLTRLVRTDPLALYGPGAEALVVGIIACEVTVLDQAPARVAAVKVDDLELGTVSS